MLELAGQKVWFFHGDVFDVIMQHSKWLAKAGAIGYDTLIFINVVINTISKALGKGNVSLSKKIKENVKSAVKYINNFEQTAALLAAKKGYDAIVCGHIHHPEMRQINSESKAINYMNSGDWIENLTALEFNRNKWKIFTYPKPVLNDVLDKNIETDGLTELNHKEVFKIMLKEFES